eukprot:TRINITY_DN539_c1_g1_i4.p4 TRINITY_DN539_c1_g1~~TRINITY_DN539_c1_g1_i4.p4  ORF type:complete len:197 (-),score=-10.59 TRINITY_DN539_c1_g1_i4:70-660(-)
MVSTRYCFSDFKTRIDEFYAFIALIPFQMHELQNQITLTSYYFFQQLFLLLLFLTIIIIIFIIIEYYQKQKKIGIIFIIIVLFFFIQNWMNTLNSDHQMGGLSSKQFINYSRYLGKKCNIYSRQIFEEKNLLEVGRYNFNPTYRISRIKKQIKQSKQNGLIIDRVTQYVIRVFLNRVQYAQNTCCKFCTSLNTKNT